MESSMIDKMIISADYKKGTVNVPFVSILVAVKDAAEYIGDCLDALLRLDYPKDRYEILVMVEDNSTDGTAEIVSGYKAPVQLIMVNFRSPAKAYNYIIDKTRGDILGFVDGDANVDKDWLKKVVKPLKDPKVAGATGLILTQNKERLVPRVVGYDFQYKYERLPEKLTRVVTMDTVYKKEVLKRVGCFNEELKTGYDCEIGHRITNAGYEIILVHDAKVYHNHRPTLWSYFKQNYEYGKYALLRNLKNPKIAKGDEVVSLKTISQPLLLVVILFLLLLSILTRIHYMFALILAFVLIGSYVYRAAKIANEYHDTSALFLVIIYPVRYIAWLLGCFVMLLKLIKSGFYEKILTDRRVG